MVRSACSPAGLRRDSVAPVLVATEGRARTPEVVFSSQNDRVLEPIACNGESLAAVFRTVLESCQETELDPEAWQAGRYSPTPTIIEAATALYNGHLVT